MLKYIIILLALLSNLTFAEVYTDMTLRPCDPEIAARWQYTPTPVEAPGTSKLPFYCEGKTKVFEITAEEVMSVFDETYEPGPVYTWGYNGSNPGPVMEILEGERIKVIFKNKLPEATTLHWHGLEVPYDQDGAAHHSQHPVKPGEGFVYEWTVEQAGTFMYHSSTNLSKQLSMGLVGFLIIHPEKIPETMVDHDLLFFLQMWALPPHSIYPDVMEMMMFNYFTMNGKSSPYIPSPTIMVGEKVRVRFANMSMMEHPVHLHGHTWRVVATGAGDNPSSSHTYGNTLLIPTAQTMDVIIDNVDEPGEWMFHCHLPHHVTNNMDVDIIPGEPMFMDNGGMHVVLKVFKGPGNPGYENPRPEEGGGDHGGGHGGHSMAAPKFTTYDGYIRLPEGQRISASLEFFKAQEGKEWRKVKAYLKIFLNEDEFLTYEYDQVKYNFETGLMNLESDEKSLTLLNLSYMDHGDMGMISGEVSIDFGAIVGEIKLETRDEELPDIKLKSNLSISGEYESTCQGKDQRLQLISARNFNEEDIETSNPMAGFIISGATAVTEGKEYRVDSYVSEAYYDPFRLNLNLKLDRNGAISSLSCKPQLRANKIRGLICENSCTYQKKDSLSKDQISLERVSNFKTDSSVVISELDPARDLHGNYRGLLGLKSGQVMEMELKINAKRYATNSMVITKNFISGNAILNVGNKSLISKIKERSFLDSSSKVNNGRNLLLLEAHNNLELIINRWSKKAISGEAYHKNYGYLGKFQVQKDSSTFTSVVKNSSNLHFLPAVDGVFTNSQWELQLIVSEIEEASSGSVFSPLHIKGHLKTKDNNFQLNISNGSYDFALNVLYLKTEDGRLLKGFVSENGVELIIPSKPLRRTRYLDFVNSRIILNRN